MPAEIAAELDKPKNQGQAGTNDVQPDVPADKKEAKVKKKKT